MGVEASKMGSVTFNSQAPVTLAHEPLFRQLRHLCRLEFLAFGGAGNAGISAGDALRMLRKFTAFSLAALANVFSQRRQSR